MYFKRIKQDDVWPIRQQVMWPDKTMDFVKLEGDEDAAHFGLFSTSELVTIISCFEVADVIQLRKFATLPAHQNNGYGTQLLNFVINSIREQDYKKIWCNARVEKVGFYKKFGFKETNETFSKSGKDYVVIELLLN